MLEVPGADTLEGVTLAMPYLAHPPCCDESAAGLVEDPAVIGAAQASLLCDAVLAMPRCGQ